MITVTLRHNFETAHRLFALGPDQKCWNVHGHSWWVDVDVAAPDVDSRGMVVEFGAYKRLLRRWIDDNLDHGMMLNDADPLVDVLDAAGCKHFVTHADPTVEHIAVLLRAVATELLATIEHADGAQVTAVRVMETHVNGASA